MSLQQLKTRIICKFRGESCARMRKRIRQSNRELFAGRVMETNIYQAMEKL